MSCLTTRASHVEKQWVDLPLVSKPLKNPVSAKNFVQHTQVTVGVPSESSLFWKEFHRA